MGPGEQLDRFFDLSIDLLCIARFDGWFERVNAAWTRTLGWTREELLAQPYAELIHPDDRAATAAAAARLVERGDVIAFDNRYRCKDGGYRWLSWNAAPVPAEGRIYACARDVTARRSAADARRRLVANVSHELRTPMNAILGMTTLALATELTGEQRDYLTTLRASACSLLALLDDLLDLSKLDAGRLELEAVPLDLGELFADALRGLAIRAADQGLELALRIAPEVPPCVVGDPTRLRQIVINLVGNAIKFTARGEVVVTVDRDPDPAPGRVALRIVVADTGIGIAPAQQETIFDAFAQADPSTTRRYGGTGLGLTIVRELIARMGGAVSVDSEPGRGSRFTVTIAVGIGTSGARRDPGALAGARALVVDDHATSRAIAVDLLGRWGMRAEAADDGTAALARLDAARADGAPFAVALVDTSLPGGGGAALVEAIRRSDGARPAVVLLSSTVQRPSAAWHRDHDVAAFVLKPIKPSELFDALALVLGGAYARAPSRDAIAPAAHALDVLLAEDSPVNQTVAARLLEKRGHRVTVVGDGAAAIAAVARRRFDVVLMDVQMPGIDGVAAARAIREAGERVPIVAMTAAASAEDRAQCLAAGMDGFLAKPIDPHALFEQIERIAGPPPVAYDELYAHAGGDRALAGEVARLFVDDYPARLGALIDALGRNDAAAAARAAHQLRGSAASLGGRRAAELAASVEALALAGDAGDAAATAAVLRAELARMAAALEQLP